MRHALPHAPSRDALGDGHPDGGFTLIEAVVAMVLLIVMAVTVLSAVMATTRLADQVRSRTVATELAAREVATARTMVDAGDISTDDVLSNVAVDNPTPLDGGTAGADIVVAGTSYTVTRQVGLSVGTEGQTLCTSSSTSLTGSDALMVRIEVTVTWSTRTSLAPVRLVEFAGLPNGLSGDAEAIVVVRVVDPTAGGTGVPGVSVTLRSRTWYYTIDAGTTDDEGCVVGRVPKRTAQVTTNTYTVVASKSGYVGQAWTDTAAVEVGRFTYGSGSVINRAVLSYAPSASVRVHITTEDGTAAATDEEAAGQDFTLICSAAGTLASEPGQVTVLTGASLEFPAVWPCQYSAYVGADLPATMTQVEAAGGDTIDIWVRPGHGIVPAPGSPGAPTVEPTEEPTADPTTEPTADPTTAPTAQPEDTVDPGSGTDPAPDPTTTEAAG